VAGAVKGRTTKPLGAAPGFLGESLWKEAPGPSLCRGELKSGAYILAEGAGDPFGEFDLVFGAGLVGVLFEG
jgi:hypothetical protein